MDLAKQLSEEYLKERDGDFILDLIILFMDPLTNLTEQYIRFKKLLSTKCDENDSQRGF